MATDFARESTLLASELEGLGSLGNQTRVANVYCSVRVCPNASDSESIIETR